MTLDSEVDEETKEARRRKFSKKKTTVVNSDSKALNKLARSHFKKINKKRYECLLKGNVVVSL